MKKSIVEKLAAITGELGAISKDKKKGSQLDYGYQGIDDVINALNPLMAKYGIVCHAHILSKTLERVEMQTKYGVKDAMLATVDMRYIFTDGEASVSTEESACKTDYSDKALTQAQSMAYKYALIRMFQIRTKDAIDPDEPAKDYVPAPERQKETTKPQLEAPKISVQEKLDAFKAALKEAGLSYEKYTQNAEEGIKKIDWRSLEICQTQEALKKAANEIAFVLKNKGNEFRA